METFCLVYTDDLWTEMEICLFLESGATHSLRIQVLHL